MTDAELLAKVRQAAAALLRAHAVVIARRAAVPADETMAISARVALAMVEQWEWHQGVVGMDSRFRAPAHAASAARILSALRAAVGE